MIVRLLEAHELPLIWTIDRTEHIDLIYRLQDGNLVLEPLHVQLNGWPAGRPEALGAELEQCFHRGGIFHAAFDGDRVAGVAVVDPKRYGPRHDLAELKFLHVSQPYRGQGTGARLFEAAAASCRALGAGGLYVSATPTRHTIDFYLRRGCAVLAAPDPALFALEPEDIHLEWRSE